jgi:hypothetical protein
MLFSAVRTCQFFFKNYFQEYNFPNRWRQPGAHSTFPCDPVPSPSPRGPRFSRPQAPVLTQKTLNPLEVQVMLVAPRKLPWELSQRLEFPRLEALPQPGRRAITPRPAAAARVCVPASARPCHPALLAARVRRRPPSPSRPRAGPVCCPGKRATLGPPPARGSASGSPQPNAMTTTSP